MTPQLKVFISSPSDVSAERRRAALVIEKLAKEYGRFFDVMPVLWETEPMLASGHFQDAIVPPAQTDVVVLILWSRLGTPLPERTERQLYRGIDGRAPVTGTEWEFESALAAHRQKGAPDLLVYRKTAPPKAEYRSDGDLEELREQWRKLEGFWRQYFVDQGEFRTAFGEFFDLDAFESKLENDLRRLIERHVAALASHAEHATPVQWLKGSPFRGLETYSLEHAPIFFGRSNEAKTAVERLIANAETGRPFLLILGASGTGKSSLVQAGVVPALAVRGVVPLVGEWLCAVMRPAGQPNGAFASLAAALTSDDCLPNLLAGQSVQALARHLEVAAANPSFPIISALSTMEKMTRMRGDFSPHEEIRLVVVVDQLEELFTLAETSPAQRVAFISCLDGLMRSGRIFVVATMRSDYWHRAAETPLLVALAEGRGRLDLLSPTQSEIAEMIRRPAEVAGLSFEINPRTGIGLDAALAEEAAQEPGALPLISFLLDALYAQDVQKTGGTVLRWESMLALGGLRGAIATRAETALAALPADVQAFFPKVLRALVTVSRSDAEPTAQPAPMSRFVDGTAERRIVDTLLDPQMRLIVAEGDGTVSRVRLAHEALLTHWARAKQQVAQDREDLRTRTSVEEALAEWRSANAIHKRDFLLRDPRLASAIDLLGRWKGELGEPTRIFIEASRRQARVRQRFAMAAAAVFAMIAIAASALGSMAYRSQQQAERERQRAEVSLAQAEREHQRAENNLARALLAQSRMLAGLIGQQLKEGSPATAALLGIEALPDRSSGIERPYAPEAEAALFAAVHGVMETAVLAGHDEDVASAAFSPDGSRIVTASWDRTARIWDAGSHAPIAVLGGHEAEVRTAAFSPDGKHVVTASDDKTARIWDASSFAQITVLKGHGAQVRTAAFSPDGRRVVTASDDKTARIWDTGNYAQILVIHTDKLESAAFSPDGSRVVTTSKNNTVRIWNARDGVQIAVLNTKSSSGVTFSPDGRSLVTATVEQSEVQIWDAETLGQIAVLKGHDLPVLSVAFSPDGRRVVTGSLDKTARLWDLETQEQLAVLKGHDDLILDATFSPDGRRIVTASKDNTARIWDAEMRGQIRLFDGFGYGLWSADFSPDGRRVVTGSGYKTASIWDAETYEQIAVLEGHGATVLNAAFSPDGSRLVTASKDNTARIWDVETRTQTGVLKGHDAAVTSAMFSPDGSRVVTASEDKTARIWDVTTATEVAVLKGHAGNVSSAAFSPDGSRVVTASWDNTARIWDVATHAQIGSFWQRLGLFRAAFSPDGQRIVIASGDGTARIWDIKREEEIGVLKGHGGPVVSVAYSPDGRRVLTGSFDSTARIWDVGSQAQLAVLPHHRRLASVAFSPDGWRVLTTTLDGARLWRSFPTTQDLVDYAKSAVPRCLERTERERFGLDPEAPDWCYEFDRWPYQHVRFGMFVKSLDDETRTRLKIQQTEGVVVARVVKGLPAAKAGVAVDDVIVAQDGKAVQDTQVLLAALAAVSSDGTTELMVLRDGQPKKFVMKPRF